MELANEKVIHRLDPIAVSGGHGLRYRRTAAEQVCNPLDFGKELLALTVAAVRHANDRVAHRIVKDEALEPAEIHDV